METRFIISDILEMLKMIKDDKGKQNKVRKYLENLSGLHEDLKETKAFDENEEIIPMDIIEMITAIKDDENKLLRALHFIEDEIIEKKENKNEEAIVDEYKNVCAQIITGMEAGFISYINPETLEIEQVQSDTVYEPEEFEEQNDDILDEYQLDYMKWDDYITFEPLSELDLSTMMEDFIRQQPDKKFATKLEDALTIEESYDKFKALINASAEHKQAWENFKKNATENYVRNHLIEELKNRKGEEIMSESSDYVEDEESILA